MSDPYTMLAPLYDRFMGDPELTAAWEDMLHEVIMRYHPYDAPMVCADVGCGTGRMLPFLSLIAEWIYAVDRSEAMLERARAVLPTHGQVVRQDLGQLDLPEPVDIMTCMLDTVNHLTEPDDVRAFFGRALQNLKPGGLLIFDVLAYVYMDETLGDEIYYEIEADEVLLWVNTFEPETGLNTALLTHFAAEADGRYRRVETQVEERYYAPDMLVPMLESVGFTQVYVDPIPMPEASGARHLLVCVA